MDQLIERLGLDPRIIEAARTLVDGRHENKMCKYTLHTGSTDITMIVRRPPLSNGKKKSLIFQVTIWIKRFIYGVGRRLKRITEAYKRERAIPLELLNSGNFARA